MRRNHHIAEALRAERTAAGNPSYARLSHQVYDLLGTFTPTAETIRAYHDPDRIPDQMNPVVLAAIVQVYERRVSDLDESAGEDVKRVADLLRRQSRCTARSLAAA